MYKIYTNILCWPQRRIPKILLIMKLTTVLLFAVIMQVSATGFAQKVTLKQSNLSLKQLFKEIRKQTGYDVLYQPDKVNTAATIDANFKDTPLDEVLTQSLQGQPLEYTIKDKTVVIKPKGDSFFDNLRDKAAKLLALPADITGTVIDSLGQPLVGASVSLKETKFNTLTDNKGNFTFSSVPQGKCTLIITYIGYAKVERNIETEGKELNLRLILHMSSSSLDQVQIIAYGSDTRRFSVGSVSTVSAEDIARQPVSNVLLALEGQAPGLAVNAISGVPGSNVLVQIRGQNTLRSDPNNGFKPYDQPLIIIDGVPFAQNNSKISQLSSLATATSISGGISQPTGMSPFNNINPQDIESISILKDADATSIYGTQGSNGVILITTKKGKPGKTTVNVNVNTQFNSNARPVQLLNTQQYIQFRKDAFAADGKTPTKSNARDLFIFDQNKYTDWEKIINGKTSNNTDVHANISGGSVNNTFLVSTGYTRSNYNFPGSFADQRLTLHSALHNTSADKRFTLDLITDYGYDQNNSPGFGGSQKVLLPPNIPDLLDAAGNLVWSYQGVNLSSYQFYSYLKQPTNLQNYNLNGSLYLSYKVLTGLAVGANLGYNRNTTSEHSENPAASQSPSNPYVYATFANSAYQAINIEPQINYTKTIGKGVLSALLGSTYKKNIGNSNNIQGYGYSNDNLLGSIAGAATIYAYDNSNVYKYSALFARLKYIYDQKYIIDLTGRRDGSSNFGPGHQFGNFGSLGAGWIFSEEGAFKKALPFISYAKLSGSYGTTGSDGIQAYQYQALWQPITYIPAFQGVTPNAPGNLYNPDYSWALKKSLNVALDFGFFNNRLLLNATYYRSREGNQLVGYQLPIQTGFSSVLGNLNATVQNKGFEFSATSTNFKTKNFSWTTNFNISFNRNKLLSFPNLASSTYSSEYVIGQPTSIIFGYRYKDVNPTTGLFEFYNKDGGLTSKPNYGLVANGGDQVPIANMEVKYMGGFGNNFSYKHFSLYVFCQFSSQTAPTYLAKVYSNSPPGLSLANNPLAMLNNYWKNPGDNAMLQRLSSGFSSVGFTSAVDFSQSSGVYDDDIYLRLKTVALSYALPDALLKKVHIQGGRIYVNAQNLLTVTDYKVGDPEAFGDYTSFPLQRTIAFGLNLNF
jgi:TonB-linked SusC/RagA family outer membrane protein